MLKPGHRVDAQVFATKQTPQGQESEARTAFQNITVLAVNAQAEPSSLGGFNAPTVTLLATPREADQLGLADSFGRIRLALRNPIDESRETKAAMPLTAVFRGGTSPAPAPAAAETRGPAPKQSKSQVGLSVELLSASPEAMKALKRFGVTGKQDVLGTAQVNAAGDLERVLSRLRENKAIDVLSLSKVNAAVSRTAAVELQAREAGALRVQFSPFVANGQMHLRVQPEMTVASGAAPGTRKLETEVDISTGRSFVISWIKDTLAAASEGRQLLVWVRPSL